MGHKKVLKGVKIIGVIFIAVSVVELVFALLMSLTPVIVNNESVALSTILVDSSFFPIEGIFFWTFLIMLICCYLVLGLAFIKLSMAQDLEVKTLTRYLSILGMLIMIMTFVKVEYHVLLDKTILTNINGSATLSFQTFLYNTSITPLLVAVMWIAIMGIACGYLLIGLFVAASGLKFQIEIEKREQAEATG